MEPRYTISGSFRHAARLAAVQILYQIEQSESSSDIAMEQFESWLEKEFYEQEENKFKKRINIDLLRKIIFGISDNSEKIDAMISSLLIQGWEMERLPSVLKAILRAASYELMFEDTPKAVIINEYIEITKCFFIDNEVAFVNGLLDKIQSPL